MPQQARRWTQEEDRLLQREVQAQLKDGQVKDWRCIADQLPGRTNKDCRKRWHNAIAGGSNKGHWTQDEDRALVDAVKTHGKAWTAVAKAVPTRNAEQCAKRWKQCLDPELDRSQWTETENELLWEAHSKHGRRWKDIQLEYFPNRSRNMIKNQFTILSRRLSQGTKPGPASARKSKKATPPTEQLDGAETDDDDDDAMTDPEISSDEGPVHLPILNDTLPEFPLPMDDFLHGLSDTNLLSEDIDMEGMLNPAIFQDPDPTFIGSMPSQYSQAGPEPGLIFPSASSAQDPVAQSAGLELYGLPAELEAQSRPGRITLTVDDPSLETTASLIQIAVANNTRFRVERD